MPEAPDRNEGTPEKSAENPNLEVAHLREHLKTLGDRLDRVVQVFYHNSSPPEAKASESPSKNGSESQPTPASPGESRNSSSSSQSTTCDSSSERADLEDTWIEFDLNSLDGHISEYLESRHCTLWGEQWTVTEEKGRKRAVEFIRKTMLGVLEHQEGKGESHGPV